MTEIPEVKETGSSGTQEVKSGELVIPEKQESPFQHYADVVQGLAEDQPRSMGGRLSAGLLAASFVHLTNELSETKSELKSTRETLDSVRGDLAQSQTQEAVLEERVSNATRWRHVSNFLATAGTIFIVIGIGLVKQDIETLGWPAGFIGLILVFLGWFYPISGRRQ